MLNRIKYMLMSARTIKPIAFLLVSLVSLLAVAASLAACVPVATQKSALAQSLGPAAFNVRDLAVSPVKVNKGEEVRIIANVINTGSSTGPYTAELKINNAIVASKTLDIPAGAIQTLNFVVPTGSAGTYEAVFGDLKGTFTVTDIPANVIQASNVTSSTTSAANTAAPSASCCSPSATTPTITPQGSSGASCCTPSSSPTASPLTFPTGGGGGCCGR